MPTRDPRGTTTLGLLEELENSGFECEAGHLVNFTAWHELKRRAQALCDHADSLQEEIERLRAREPVPNMLEMVERFNREIIGLTIPDKPTMLEGHRSDFRRGHLLEELSEIAHGADHEDMPLLVDGLLDLIYVAMGWLVEMGVTVGASFEEVHAANMAKERGEVATRPGSKGYDAVKPEGWTPPDLAPYLSLTRGEVTWMMDQREIADTWVPGQEEDEDKGAILPQYEGYDKETALRLIAAPAQGLVLPSKTETAVVKIRRRPRILVIGHARHGKDTVCGMLRDMYDLHFTSSSEFCAAIVLWPILQLNERASKFLDSLPSDKPMKRTKLEEELAVMRRKDYYGPTECFEDRANHREFWFEAIRAYNRPDPTALARALLADNNDVYCGMRASAELHACRNTGVFDFVIWVDASERREPEGRDSCTVEPWMADHVIDTNGTVEDTMFNLKQLMDRILL